MAQKNTQSNKQGSDFTTLSVTVEYIKGDVSETKADVKELREIIMNQNIAMEARLNARIDVIDSRTRNTPLVERVVFGLVGIILIAVMGALVGLVVIGGSA